MNDTKFMRELVKQKNLQASASIEVLMDQN